MNYDPKGYQIQYVARKGRIYEFVGFLLIVAGAVGCMMKYQSDGLGSNFGQNSLAMGFIIFLIGQFM